MNLDWPGADDELAFTQEKTKRDHELRCKGINYFLSSFFFLFQKRCPWQEITAEYQYRLKAFTSPSPLIAYCPVVLKSLHEENVVSCISNSSSVSQSMLSLSSSERFLSCTGLNKKYKQSINIFPPFIKNMNKEGSHTFFSDLYVQKKVEKLHSIRESRNEINLPFHNVSLKRTLNCSARRIIEHPYITRESKRELLPLKLHGAIIKAKVNPSNFFEIGYIAFLSMSH